MLAKLTICQKNLIKNLDLVYCSRIPYICFLKYTSAQKFKFLINLHDQGTFVCFWPQTIKQNQFDSLVYGHDRPYISKKKKKYYKILAY